MMDETSARIVLGIGQTIDAATLRQRFRSILREVHPDLNASADGAQRTRDVVEAFRVVRETLRTEATSETEKRIDATFAKFATFATLLDDETLVVDAPPDEVYSELVGVGHEIGSVTYLDRDEQQILEVLLTTTGGDTISLVISLQGRSNGVTEAFLTLEPLDVSVRELPTIRGVAQLVANHLNDRSEFSV